MFRQIGQHHPSTELNTASADFVCSCWMTGEGLSSAPGTPVPSFLSSAPPRSEGEALLRRIFSRGEVV